MAETDKFYRGAGVYPEGDYKIVRSRKEHSMKCKDLIPAHGLESLHPTSAML